MIDTRNRFIQQLINVPIDKQKAYYRPWLGPQVRKKFRQCILNEKSFCSLVIPLILLGQETKEQSD